MGLHEVDGPGRPLEEDLAYRCVAMEMGGWRWGWPRGKRTGIVAYRVGVLKNGRKVWKSMGFVCQGLTAANVDFFRARYPEAFEAPDGSLHNKAVEE